MNVKILIIDFICDAILKELQDRYEADYFPEITFDELIGVVEKYDILIISTRIPINAKLLERARNLKFIIRMGVGIDHIDLSYCKSKGVKLANTPNSNISPVAELVFGQIIRAYRYLEEAQSAVANNKFREGLRRGSELKNKTIGIIGVGRIGGRIAKIAKAFGATTLGYDPYLSDGDKKNREIDVWKDNLPELLVNSDIATLHVPLTGETINMVDTKFLDAMKERSILINSSRGKAVNFQELINYQNIDKFKKIILDVYDKEPYRIQNIPKKIRDIFYFSPHIGAYTDESLYDRGEETLKLIEEYLSGDIIHGLIDLDRGY
ncbi:MAG TPA: NAD(P)-dependent oxidoreductase [Spirochaetota bacterium]|jgi:D-3-phosphoglycerate dehydrogenase|nr:MAG: D-3-phosphoglycerate dehydrogenase [Spirochaetes bacterium ADurb.Bin133]HNZ27605.1 NAD(P)-dependent oxidoreductase [Spirochaetota bacterium]HPY86904.1 NAD(P)-dependent oxidoreductase [Spirochaetota bacterium]HQB61082.1 NAD(P)-dependent oxidoreductase [Spirochaetota bacterium]